jgi:hypothetical protein
VLAARPAEFPIRSTAVYDMYPWDDSAAAPGPAPAGGRPAQTPAGPSSAIRAGTAPGTPLGAVQVALDRRDNGGDAAAAPGTLPPARAHQ